MTSATKVPPQIAPGILCPKCKGPMLDERANKRTDKSPDYTCSNMLCTDASGKYRTAIWEEKKNGSTSAAPAPAGQTGGSAPAPAEAAPDRLAQRSLYANRMKQAVKYVLEEIEPLYKAKGIGMSDDGVYKHAYSIWQEWSRRGIIS